MARASPYIPQEALQPSAYRRHELLLALGRLGAMAQQMKAEQHNERERMKEEADEKEKDDEKEEEEKETRMKERAVLAECSDVADEALSFPFFVIVHLEPRWMGPRGSLPAPSRVTAPVRAQGDTVEGLVAQLLDKLRKKRQLADDVHPRCFCVKLVGRSEYLDMPAQLASVLPVRQMLHRHAKVSLKLIWREYFLIRYPSILLPPSILSSDQHDTDRMDDQNLSSIISSTSASAPPLSSLEPPCIPETVQEVEAIPISALQEYFRLTVLSAQLSSAADNEGDTPLSPRTKESSSSSISSSSSSSSISSSSSFSASTPSLHPDELPSIFFGSAPVPDTTDLIDPCIALQTPSDSNLSNNNLNIMIHNTNTHINTNNTNNNTNNANNNTNNNNERGGSVRYWVEVGIYHGTRRLGSLFSTPKRSHPEWADAQLFSIVPLRELPREAAASLRLLREARGRPEVLAWVNVPLFDHAGLLVAGRLAAPMWGAKQHPPRRIGTSAPLDPCGAALLALEFAQPPLPVAFCPPLPPPRDPDAAASAPDGLASYGGTLQSKTLARLTEREQSILWSFRAYFIAKTPELIPNLLKCVNWNDQGIFFFIYNILYFINIFSIFFLYFIFFY